MKKVLLSTVLVLALALSFTSCRDTKEKTEDAVENAADAASDAVDSTKETAGDAVDDVKEAADDAVEDAKDMAKVQLTKQKKKEQMN